VGEGRVARSSCCVWELLLWLDYRCSQVHCILAQPQRGCGISWR
jgi:hypothetical protein